MKTYKYLYKKMLDETIIKEAYKKLRKGKTKRIEIMLIDANLDDEVQKMKVMLENTKPSGYQVEHPELAFKPRKKTPRVIVEHGKERKIYMPEIREQWVHHIITMVLEPIIMKTADRNSCGSFPNRGAHYGKRIIKKWISEGSGIRNFGKIDIRHFYDNIRLPILMNFLRERIHDDLFLYIVELCFKYIPKGIPLGFYISQWLANYILEPLDQFIKSLGIKKSMRYMDDIVIFDDNKKKLHRAIVEIMKFLGRKFRLKLKHNYQVCKFYYVKKNKKVIGRRLDFMGFLFYRDKITMRKSIMLAATRLASRLASDYKKRKNYHHHHIRAMLSYLGWFKSTNSYHCFLDYVKPHINVKKLKRIISKLDRRKKHEDMGRRIDNRVTRRVTGNCSRALYATP